MTDGTPSEQVEAYMAKLKPELRGVFDELRKLVLRSSPSLSESLKWNQPWYSRNQLVCTIYRAGDHVNLGFARGAELKDSQGLLEGTGKGSRQVKVEDAKNIPREAIRTLLGQAVKLDSEAWIQKEHRDSET